MRMVLAHYGLTYSEEALSKRCATSLLGTACVHLFQLAVDLGLSARLLSGLTRDEVEWNLAQGRPLIVTVNPAILFPGSLGWSHGIVVVGSEAEAVVLHDPQRGPDRVVPWLEFTTAGAVHGGKAVVIWRL
jgi:ABC-type bacteriocin/lantibiotic exporter with double-glycine peptidase domain